MSTWLYLTKWLNPSCCMAVKCGALVTMLNIHIIIAEAQFLRERDRGQLLYGKIKYFYKSIWVSKVFTYYCWYDSGQISWVHLALVHDKNIPCALPVNACCTVYVNCQSVDLCLVLLKIWASAMIMWMLR
jgi:hypothetical protein